MLEYRLRKMSRTWFDSLFCTFNPKIKPLGKNAQWFYVPELLNENSIIVSGGVGRDISFEHRLFDIHGCVIHLFDPSPTGVEFMKRSENQREHLNYYPLGLTGGNGRVSFAPPDNPLEGSYRTPGNSEGANGFGFDCVTLSKFCDDQGFGHIDLLKIDIEGFEYEVLEEALGRGLLIGQICVEYHNFLQGHSNWETLKSISLLYRKGFRLAHKRGSEYLFLNVKYVKERCPDYFSIA